MLITLTLMLVSSCKGTGKENNSADANKDTPKEVIIEDWYFFRLGNAIVSTKDGIPLRGYNPIKINPVSKTSYETKGLKAPSLSYIYIPRHTLLLA